MRVRPLLLAAGLLTGCGAPPALPKPGEPPFSAAQVRDATPEGRQYRFRIEQPGKPPFIQVLEFVDVDEHGATLRQRSMAQGAPPDAGETAQARVSWAALESHGRSPLGTTRVSVERITVPAGTFDCLRYTIRKGAHVTRSWFARVLPGAPIQQEVVNGDARTFRMTLLAHHPVPSKR